MENHVMAGSVGKTGPPGFDDPGSIVVIVAVLDGETGALPASDNRGFIIISIFRKPLATAPALGG